MWYSYPKEVTGASFSVWRALPIWPSWVSVLSSYAWVHGSGTLLPIGIGFALWLLVLWSLGYAALFAVLGYLDFKRTVIKA
jgi:hypothetical protein